MRRDAVRAAVLGLACLAALGCSSVRPFPAGTLGDMPASDFSYLAGRATRTFAAPPAAVRPAIVAAMDDLRIVAIRQTSEGGILTVEGTTADNRSALVTLKAHPGGSTHVFTRIGLLGDEPLSRALMDRVAIRLGTLPPTAVPVEPPATTSSHNPYFSRSAVPDSVMLKDQSDAPYRSSPVP